MPSDLRLTDLPDEIRATLSRRATRHGSSLRHYVVGVLAEHCALPSMDEWLHEAAELPPVEGVTGAEAVALSRAEDTESLLAGARR